MLKILIADDHKIVREGLKDILREAFAFVEIGEADNAAMLADMSIAKTWDLIISDFSMPGGGFEALRKLHILIPEVPLLILSLLPEEHYAARLLRAGASGYLNKAAASSELVKVIEMILAGKKYIPAGVALELDQAGNIPPDRPPHESLSEREFSICLMLADGKSISEIASLLQLSDSTVSTYRARILNKMKLRSNADLMRYARDHRLTNQSGSDL
jgi:two-component system, NarL family, invasion response regulator UvrY